MRIYAVMGNRAIAEVFFEIFVISIIFAKSSDLSYIWNNYQG